MIQQAITIFNTALASTQKFADIYCLGELRADGDGRKVPYAYTGSGEFRPVDLGTGSLTYWRLASDATFQDITPKYSAARMVQGEYLMRLVMVAHRSDAFEPTRLSNDIASMLIAQDGDIQTAVVADSVTLSISAIDHDTPSVYATEFSGIDVSDLHYSLFMVALNIRMVIVAPASCWANECDFDPDILHWFNFCDPTTFNRLTDAQIECLSSQICETPPTLCEQLAEVAPGNVVAYVFDCLTPEAQAELLDSECVIPPCADATYALKNTGGTTIGNGSIASGASADITAPDATANLKDSSGAPISTTSIQSATSANISAPDGAVTINGTAMTPVKSNGSNALQVLQGGVQVGSGSGLTWNVPTCPVAYSLSLATSNAIPAYAASFTVTATASGFTPTSYTFSYPSDSVGGYSRTTQAGNSLAITARGYGVQTVMVTATDGVSTVGATIQVTVAQMTQVTDFLTNTGIVDATITSAVRSLALRLDDYGIWSKVRALYPFVGGTATAHKYNLKDPRDLDAAYRIVFSGGWTHDANGVTGNGVNASADSKLANSVTGQNSLTMGVYNRTSGIGGIEWSGSVTPRTWLAGNISGTAYFDINNGASTATTTAPADVRGTLMASRVLSSATELNLNGQGQRTTAATSSAPAATTFILGQFSGGGFNTARNYAAAWLTDGLTAEEETHFRSAMQTFQTSLSRNV